MKELTVHEVQAVSGGFFHVQLNTFSRVGSFTKLAYQRGGYFTPWATAAGQILKSVVNKVKEDPAAYGRGLTTWPHYIWRPRAF